MHKEINLNGNSTQVIIERKVPPSDLFADNFPLASLVSMPHIIKVYAEKKDACTELHVQADGPISEYHKPEFTKLNLKLRIKDVLNTTEDFTSANGIYPINSVKSDLINNYFVLRITLSDELTECTSQRNGPNEILYKLYSKSNQVEAQNETIKPKTEKKDTIEKASVETPVRKPKHLEKKKASVSDDPYTENEKKKWALDVIVIDPGHGGTDPGCVSINGVQEKDITLKLGKELRDLIKVNMPETKVVMTRSDDRFIELYRRGQIANEHKGKLFISIHINAARTKPSPAKGFETFILRPGRNDEAISVAKKENEAIKFEKKQSKYVALTEDEMITATMAQSAFVKFSELFARTVQEEVGKTTPLKDRGVNQAGFYVLVGASMPNVLFEAGFASNHDDENYLISRDGQHRIALGIYNAILKYSEEYEKRNR